MLELTTEARTERFTLEDDEDFYCVIRRVTGALYFGTDEEYFQKAIIEAGGFELDGKAIARWEKATGKGHYKNGKQIHLGSIPWHDILPVEVGNLLLNRILKLSRGLDEGDAKN